MASLQNMLNVYFHMKNHYRKLKNVKSRVNSNRPKSAGRPKKSVLSCKKSSSAPKDSKERPPGRRNNIEGNAVEKNHINPKHMHHLPDKFKTTYSPISKHVHNKLEKFKPAYSAPAKLSRKQFGGQHIDENEYIQFSLHVTEEIIRNEIIDIEEMVHVIKSHYQSNKTRLNEAKLLATIKDLCSELNIAVDENLIQFLDNRSKYIRVCSESIPHNSGHRPSPRDPIHTMPSIPNRHYYMHSEQQAHVFGSNSSKQAVNCKLEESELDAVNSLGLVPIDSMNTSFDVDAPQSLGDASKNDAFQFVEETLGRFEGEDGENETEKKDEKENLKDREKEKENEEEEDKENVKKNGNESEHEKKRKNEYAKELEVLHDATLKFTKDIEKESECAFILQQLENDSNREEERQVVFESVDKSEKKFENTFVVSHYSTSIEPEIVQTSEFSVQTGLDSVQSSQTELVYVRDTIEWETVDAIANIPDPTKCCPTSESQSESPIPKNNEGSTTMTSAEVQYVLLDCPLLARLDSRTKLVGPTSDKTYYPSSNPTNLANNYLSGNCVTSGLDSNDMLNSDYYDLTPQREVFNKVPQEPSTYGYDQKRYGPSPDNTFLEQQEHQHHQRQNQAFGMFARMPNVAPTQLLSDKYETGRAFNNDTLEHLERYNTRNFTDNLSFFYPTVATQVSSMDLLIDRNVGSSKLSYYQREESPLRRPSKPPTNQRKSQFHDTYKKIARSDYRMDANATESLLELDTGESVVSSCIGYQKASCISRHKERKEMRINLDNYRLDAKRADAPSRITERQEAVVDRDVDVVRAISPGQSGHSNQSPGRSVSVEEVSGRALTIYHSNDSMERRIKNLRHDIEKYSKDDISSRRALSATTRRTDVLDLLRYNNINSDGMSSEVSSPKSKRMSILRKQSNLADT